MVGPRNPARKSGPSTTATTAASTNIWRGVAPTAATSSPIGKSMNPNPNSRTSSLSARSK